MKTVFLSATPFSITMLRFSCRDYGDEGRDDLGFRICRYVSDKEDGRVED